MAARTGIPERILVAPDSFKGTLTALEVAQAVCRGLQRAGRSFDCCPVADGGEGTLTALMPAFAAERQTITASDPLGRPVEAEFALGTEGRGRLVGVLEMASASGLGLVPESERDPIAATTFGTGQLIMAAVRSGAKLIYVGVGGSATSDGGVGAIEAIDADGGLGEARLVVLCDVRTRFADAARVFGAQKGADEKAIRSLTERLHELAERLPRDPRQEPMTGAAGGLAGGLWAKYGAELVPGAAFVLDALAFDDRMRQSRAVVTGEGRLDQQSLAGKLISEIATRARQAGVPCHAIVGRRDLDRFGARVLDLQAIFEAGTVPELEAAAQRLAEVV